ncbi:hypothetical protein [Granulicatella sp. HMSC31F03]|uniref:hypothetical protein n=1 Tax=Granulicatella sp. HMSC31F03 TaxID=1581074 RepID=UPI0008A20927|nr:hypothetical protein [Granulicatella sp. HMSC31F03]OFT00941.1 hypothetical protein HMPREF3106_04920 [Granulicatella sp. HMSC31F03]
MFGNEETLIVVYKDEMVLNQFKKLVESRNRDQEYLANHPELNIIAWNEKTWLSNKKAGNIKGKILYLGQLSGTKELIPVIDTKFQKYGVCFGWAGNQAVLYGNHKYFKTKEEYLEFVSALNECSVPESIKKPINASFGEENDVEIQNDEEVVEPIESENKKGLLSKLKNGIGKGVALAKEMSSDLKDGWDNLTRSKKAVVRQMLFFGVDNIFKDGLDEFVKS